MVDKKAKKEAVAEHKAAKEHLAEVSRRTTTETDEYLAANARVIAAEKNVSWWRR